MNNSLKIEFRALRILVHDEDSKRGGNIRQILDNLGIGETYNTSAEMPALECVRINKLSMALIDLEELDSSSGPVALLKILRDPGRSPAPGLPVLGMMANVTRESLISAVNVGSDLVIQRPFSARVLSDRIVSMISAPAPQYESSKYVGPDRRRIPDNLYDGNLRRSDDP